MNRTDNFRDTSVGKTTLRVRKSGLTRTISTLMLLTVRFSKMVLYPVTTNVNKIKPIIIVPVFFGV
jgi:hypothetical protein